MDNAENERQFRVLDQMLSMHASLRDNYARWAFVLNISLIAISIILCAFVFASDNVLATIGLKPEAAHVGLGLVSVAVLILSIVEFRVDWKNISSRHAEAAKQLANLKGKYRRLYSETEGKDSKKNERLSSEYERVMRTITSIPDRKFNCLKAKHNFKKLLSQQINLYPKTPCWYLRLKLRYEGFLPAGKKDTPNDSIETDRPNPP